MPLLWDTELIRVDDPVEPEHWIDIKKELTSADDDAAWEALAKVDAASAEDMRLSVRVTALNRERVRRSIVAWSYTHNEQPVPVEPDTIDRLDRRTYAALVERVDQLNPLVVPKTSGISTTGSVPGTAATRAARRTA